MFRRRRIGWSLLLPLASAGCASASLTAGPAAPNASPRFAVVHDGSSQGLYDYGLKALSPDVGEHEGVRIVGGDSSGLAVVADHADGSHEAMLLDTAGKGIATLGLPAGVPPSVWYSSSKSQWFWQYKNEVVVSGSDGQEIRRVTLGLLRPTGPVHSGGHPIRTYLPTTAGAVIAFVNLTGDSIYAVQTNNFVSGMTNLDDGRYAPLDVGQVMAAKSLPSGGMALLTWNRARIDASPTLQQMSPSGQLLASGVSSGVTATGGSYSAASLDVVNGDPVALVGSSVKGVDTLRLLRWSSQKSTPLSPSTGVSLRVAAGATFVFGGPAGNHVAEVSSTGAAVEDDGMAAPAGDVVLDVSP